MATQSNGLQNGGQAVSLLAMQAELDKLRAEKAAGNTAPKLNSPAPAKLNVPVKAAAPEPAPVPVPATLVKATFKDGRLVPPTGAAKVTSGRNRKPCGSKSPNGLCQRCILRDDEGEAVMEDGDVVHLPFNAILHFMLDALQPLDGILDEETAEDAPITVDNQHERKYLGVSTDPTYFGNVCVVGIGKDVLNMRPKTFLTLASALEDCKSAKHVMTVLPERYWKAE